jgi:hypothetical protein
MAYIKQDKPFVVPTTDGKLIEEHFGLASVKQPNLSIAHMVAPRAGVNLFRIQVLMSTHW